MKKAMTVFGPVEGDKLGHILPHEHILMEFPELNIPPLYPELVDKKVTIDILGRLRRQIWTCRDNLKLDQPEVALEEVASFRQNGGGTIVDVTPVGLKRNVKAVVEITRKTGVHIVLGTGYYIQQGHPAEVAGLTIQQIQDWIVKEVTIGIEASGAKAGIIGEIGISSPMHPDEEKTLRAAARAHKITGATLTIHQYGGKELIQIDAILREESVPPERAILCHMSSATPEQRFWAAGCGYYVELDCFGNEYYNDPMAGIILRDPDRIRIIKGLIERGHQRQVLVSNDVALKMLWKKYGGWSYEHIIKNIKPLMLREGISPKSIDTMIYYNPMRAICYLD